MLVPFPPAIAHTLDELRGRVRSPAPLCDITVHKGDRTRRYVLSVDAPGYFVGEVYFGEVQHRRHIVAGVLLAKRLAGQFSRELRELLDDGWSA